MLIEQFWKMGGHSQLYNTATDNNDKRLRKMIVRKHLAKDNLPSIQHGFFHAIDDIQLPKIFVSQRETSEWMIMLTLSIHLEEEQ